MTDPAGYVNIFLMASMWLTEDLFVQPVRKGLAARYSCVPLSLAGS